MDDARVSGTTIGTCNSDCRTMSQPPGETGCVWWGTAELARPDGTWAGWWVGPLTVLQGTGAYEGWTYVVQSSDAAYSLEGILYEGPPPPWGPPASVP